MAVSHTASPRGLLRRHAHEILLTLPYRIAPSARASLPSLLAGTCAALPAGGYSSARRSPLHPRDWRRPHAHRRQLRCFRRCASHGVHTMRTNTLFTLHAPLTTHHVAHTTSLFLCYSTTPSLQHQSAHTSHATHALTSNSPHKSARILTGFARSLHHHAPLRLELCTSSLRHFIHF